MYVYFEETDLLHEISGFDGVEEEKDPVDPDFPILKFKVLIKDSSQIPE